MYIFPYAKKSFKTILSPEEIQSRLDVLILKPSWKISGWNLVDNYVFEGKADINQFEIFLGRYGMTYGRTSLWPKLYGFVFRDEGSLWTNVVLKIRPSYGGLAIYSCLVILASLILYSSIGVDLKGVLVSLGMVIVTYFSLMYTFNKRVKEYDHFIKLNLEEK